MKRTIKSALIISCAMLCCLLTSCKDNEKLILGTWHLQGYAQHNPHVYFNDNSNEVWEFRANGKLVITQNGQLYEDWNYSVSGSDLYLSFREGTNIFSRNYIIDKLNYDKLTLDIYLLPDSTLFTYEFVR